MNAICHVVFVLWFVLTSNCQKFSPEQFPFPPQFKSPNTQNGIFGSDSSIYLPPESHTPVPYFSMSNGNKLPFQFLPPTVTKAPSVYPTSYPMMISSTMISRRDDRDHNIVDEYNQRNKSRDPQIPHPNFRITSNQTEKNTEFRQDKEMRSLPNTFNYHHPVDRIDNKPPVQFHSGTQKPQMNQSPASQRRMIISSEILKNEQGSDQIKRASILGPQLIASPITYYSTTEPAIPILRLSNEMDLDGSFSYEALGADQTHYVQNSRMENLGTDKEEQVVEGSYSYVGDNGQTYTVHYVADSNGYRASGDHLPVAPPIPEIIQRSIQYNLAEEARKPPELKSWQENDKEYERGETDKHRFLLPPPRNLFTGRTPEAFSFALSQSSILQNNVGAADNSQIPVKSNFDFSSDQSKNKINNNSPIAPQITFLASQGAHNPSKNSGSQQISRIFGSEKPTLPQLMNYEAGSIDSDQENNKALWRWQYGINANGGNENQNSNKNSISRSFGEGDDVIINFNNMSPEQYTKIIKSEFLEHNTEDSLAGNESKNKKLNVETVQLNNIYKANDNTEVLEKSKDAIEQQRGVSTENSISYTDSSDWSKHTENPEYSTNDRINYNNIYNYMNPLPLSTESYKYFDSQNEPTKTPNIYLSTDLSNLFNENYFTKENNTLKYVGGTSEKLSSDTSYSTNVAILNQDNTIKFADFIQNEEKSNFKPIANVEGAKQIMQEATTTTESSPESIIRDNYFLRNLFKTENLPNRKTEIIAEPQKLIQTNYKKINLEASEITDQPQKLIETNNKKIGFEAKLDKIPKNIQYHQSRPQNEIHSPLKTPLDMTDVLNYITLKNHFESSKLKSKNKFSNSEKFSQKLEKPQTFIPLENEGNDEEEQLQFEETQNNLRAINNQRQQQLKGIIKNYKVLQRNSNTKNMGQSKDQFMTDSSQRHLKTFQTQNLPPLGRAGPSMKSYLPPTYL